VEVDKGQGISIISDITDTLLFGLVWLTTKYSNRKPNAVTTVVDSVATLSARVELTSNSGNSTQATPS